MSSTDRRRVRRIDQDGDREVADRIAVEEPLEILVNGSTASTTMRTPGHDIELAMGWCLSEGIARARDDIVQARECFEDAGEGGIRRSVQVSTRDGALVHPRLHGTSSACGICGGDVIALTLGDATATVADDPTRFPVAVLNQMPESMRTEQRHFEASGGLHAAALFDPDGQILCLREDVGRHNAVDKVVGWALAEGRIPLRGVGIQVSGRASAELVHKAVTAGIPLLTAVSAPTSLAVDLARAAGLTLVGFARGDRLNVYARDDRIA